jgi:phthiocerol/phenolphthiocerol synthesis type-I polyketide synthase E
MSRNDLDIAVIGMACRFPGAPDVEAFWRNLQAGTESVSRFSDEELLQAGVSPEALRDPAYVQAAAVLPDVELFDARFFGCTAREAQVLDPQHRFFLETAWEALESAGYDPDRYRGSIGVFGGASGTTWIFALMSDPEVSAAVSPYQVMISTDKDYLAPRVAYKLNLSGPAVVIQTACSTSLVAVHMACQSLLSGECDMALAGGVAISLPQKAGYVYEPSGIASRDGHCRTFDAGATGTVRGSGVGLVLLKRLADALRDGDQIDAVVKGSATNNDGARKVGFTAPGVEGQAQVIRTAQAVAGVAPEDITYVEAHGTATALGDPIEVAALTQVFRAGTARRGFCAIGSVKTNFGHLDTAAGIAGLMKTVLMLKHRELVPSLHFERPNPRIDFAGSPFFVSTSRAPWPGDGRPRRAGVSSFGIGGTNAHVILEEAPEARREDVSAGPEALVLSARTQSALEAMTDNLAAHLLRHPELALADVAFTLRAGRRAFPHRRVVVSRDLPEAARLLAERDPRRAWSALAEEGRPVAFLFSGQGAQHVNMARGVYEAEPTFRAEVDACCERLVPLLGLDLRRLLYPSADEGDTAAERLNETRFTQPALFTVEYALARLWMSWGVAPEAMIGHSVGEYVAACVAGVLDRDEALSLVAERGRLMHECDPGAMTAVAMATDAVTPLLDGRLDLCAVNGPEACVVGGPIGEIERLEAHLRQRDVPHGRVPASHAFHSALMERALEPFAACLAKVPLQAPRIPFVSNRTGTWITAAEATSPAYWVRHLRETVRFSEGLDALLASPKLVLLEVGPGHTLVSLAKRRLPAGSTGLALASLRHVRQQEQDEDFLLQTAARLWASGVAIDWARERRDRRRVSLPTYPFERERFWLDPVPPDRTARPAPSGKQPIERWLYAPSWKRAELGVPGTAVAGASWCILADEAGLGDALGARLRAQGARVTIVRTAAASPGGEATGLTIDPAHRGDYERLLDELEAWHDGMPHRFVHLWAARGEDGPVEQGLLSVLHLGQAIGRRLRRETHLFVVTSAVQDVLGSEPISPMRATVLGPCRVIPQEYPLLSCRTVDVVDGMDGASPALVEAILAEVTSTATDPTVAYRGRYRWVQSFEPIEASGPAGAANRLRSRGVYLVTGGLGKVGLALAAHLARTVEARLVLTGRTGLPDRADWGERLERTAPDDPVARRIRAVQELESLGAEVLVARADVEDLDAMRRVLAMARKRFGRLDGVVHAAGEVGPGAFRPLAETERADCERQLRPKLGGAEVLDALLAEEPLDFVVLMSSLSTVLGGLGYGAYAAANHALDAFARRQQQRGRRAWTSAAWDGWRFEGDGDGRLVQTAICPAEGGEAFTRLLNLGARAEIIVSTTPLQERLTQWTRLEGVGRVTDAPSPAATDRHARPEIGTVYVAPEGPVERRLAALWAELLGIDRVGLDDNFFELGGSSLLAVHLMGRVRKEYPIDVSVATLFEAPSVRSLSGMIQSRREDPDLARSADRGQLRKESRRQQGRTSDAAVE